MEAEPKTGGQRYALGICIFMLRWTTDGVLSGKALVLLSPAAAISHGPKHAKAGSGLIPVTVL